MNMLPEHRQCAEDKKGYIPAGMIQKKGYTINNQKITIMKNKIAAIGLLTIAVLILSILVLNTTIGNIKEEALLYNSGISGSQVRADEITEDVLELPVYRKRNIAAARHQEYTGGSSSYSILPSTRKEPGIASSNSQPFSGSATVGSVSRRSSGGDNPVNYRPLAVVPAWREKPSAAMSIASAGADTKTEQTVSAQPAPFSGGGLSGPMRMEGEGDNPPPEGMPVGNGLWFMLLLAGIYALYNNLKEKVKF